jgi:RNA polymerase sigma factor (sigma-70 family)
MRSASEPDSGITDIAQLYAELSGPLEKIVRSGLHPPEAVLEDACQFAWSRLVHHRGRVRRETVLSWLAITARHEALKLIDREGRESSLEEELQRSGGLPRAIDAPFPEDVVLRREQLRRIDTLPRRQQRLMWLMVLGFSRQEIAERERCTVRTLERQLLKARRRLAPEAL